MLIPRGVVTRICRVRLGYSWGVLGLPGSSWDAPGRSWVLLGCSWDAPGLFLECFQGAFVVLPGGGRGAPGVFLECSLGVSGVLLGGSPWVLLGCTWVAPGVF